MQIYLHIVFDTLKLSIIHLFIFFYIRSITFYLIS